MVCLLLIEDKQHHAYEQFNQLKLISTAELFN